jgi:hypothetical protein
MRKHIECHYKDGALVFCTTDNYPFQTASKILDAFKVIGLVSAVREKSNNLFAVVGKLHVNYDPFIKQENKWNDMVSQLVHTKDMLENNLKSISEDQVSSF